MPRGKKSPTLKDAITHKNKPRKVLPGAVAGAVVVPSALPKGEDAGNATAQNTQTLDARSAAKQQQAAAKAKRLPTIEEIVEKLKHHGIHFDQE